MAGYAPDGHRAARAGLLRATGPPGVGDPGPGGASFGYKKAMGSERRSGGPPGPPVTRGSIPGALLAAVVAVLLAAGCAGGSRPPAASPAPLPPDPRTQAALLRIATAFNHDYDSRDYGPVYARWDARSRAIISRAAYIRRHRECPGPRQPASVTESAGPGPRGAWLVHYEIGGQQLTDYWFYVRHRWVFDLVLSNPDAVRLYRMSPQRYAAAVGCAGESG